MVCEAFILVYLYVFRIYKRFRFAMRGHCSILD